MVDTTIESIALTRTADQSLDTDVYEGQISGGAGFKISASDLSQTVSSAPGFGQAIVHSSARKRTFNFAANGSDERQKLADLYQYIADEAAIRAVDCQMGVGDFGFDGNGLRQTFANDSKPVNFIGRGSTTRIGYVGNTQSGNIWRVMEWEAENIPIVLVSSLSRITTTATCLITGTLPTIGSTVWIYSANEALFNGLKLVTGLVSGGFTYDIKNSGATTATGIIECAVHDLFLADFTIGNMRVIDTNPAAHAGATEETHGVGLRYMKNLSIINLSFSDIGDESIEISDCFIGKILNIRALGSPSQEQTGGGIISLKGGANFFNVSNFQLGQHGVNASATYGVNFKTSAQTRECTDHTISHGQVWYPTSAALKFNTTGSDVKRISINDVTTIGGEYGITENGSGNLLDTVEISNFRSYGATIRPVDLDRAIADCSNINIRNSILDAERSPDSSTGACVRIGGETIKLLNNSYRNGYIGVHGTSNSNNVKIKGGEMINCGGNETTFAQYVYDQGVNKNMIVDDVKIIDGKATRIGFRGVKVIKNLDFENTVQPSDWMALDPETFSNNDNVNQNVRCPASGSNYNHNTFTHTDSGGNGCLRLNGTNDAQVIGNKSPNLTSGNGIVEGSGSDRNIVSLNNMNGRPVNIIGSASISPDNI